MDLYSLIEEPLFWAASAFGSIVLSIIGNLCTPGIQKLFAYFSKRKRDKLKQKRFELLQEIIYVAEDQNRILDYKIDALYLLLRAIFLMVLGALFLLISELFSPYNLIIMAGASVMIARSVQWLLEAKTKYSSAILAGERNEAIRTFSREENTNKEDSINYSEAVQLQLADWDQQHIQ